MSGKYRDFPYTALYPQALSLWTSPTRVIDLLQLMNLQWHIIIIQSPYFAIGFTLGGVHSMIFDKCIMRCTHQYRIIQDSFTVVKILCWDQFFLVRAWVWKCNFFVMYLSSLVVVCCRLLSSIARCLPTLKMMPSLDSKFHFPSFCCLTYLFPLCDQFWRLLLFSLAFCYLSSQPALLIRFTGFYCSL